MAPDDGGKPQLAARVLTTTRRRVRNRLASSSTSGVPNLTNHHSSAFRVDRQELSRDDAPTAALPEGFLVDLLKHVFGRVVLQDDDAAAVAPDDDVICKQAF